MSNFFLYMKRSNEKKNKDTIKQNQLVLIALFSDEVETGAEIESAVTENPYHVLIGFFFATLPI